ncbi:MAG: hypothetical protein IIU76_01325 [Bacteroidales bacterium]|nr:hypothetical protein [Bacteroidales bacterium]
MKKKFFVATLCLSVIAMILISSKNAEAVSIDCVLHNAPGMGCVKSRGEFCVFTIKETNENCVFENQVNEIYQEKPGTDNQI